MGIQIPDEVLRAASLTGEELLVELAVYLYDKERLSFGQAKNLAQLDHLSFQKELAKRDVYIKYDVEDFREDMRNLKLFDKRIADKSKENNSLDL